MYLASAVLRCSIGLRLPWIYLRADFGFVQKLAGVPIHLKSLKKIPTLLVLSVERSSTHHHLKLGMFYIVQGSAGKFIFNPQGLLITGSLKGLFVTVVVLFQKSCVN